jgi:hypothetical protein
MICNRPMLTLIFVKRVSLAGAGTAALAALIAVGILTASAIRAQSPQTQTESPLRPKFEVASLKPCKDDFGGGRNGGRRAGGNSPSPNHWDEATSQAILETGEADVRASVYHYDYMQLERLCRSTTDPKELLSAIHRLLSRYPAAKPFRSSCLRTAPYSPEVSPLSPGRWRRQSVL